MFWCSLLGSVGNMMLCVRVRQVHLKVSLSICLSVCLSTYLSIFIPDAPTWSIGHP
jgi:hypothetical protein